jgi:hypothetical protein
MAFWDGLVKGVQNFFGGNNNNQKKKKDEEEQRRQRAASSSAPKLNVSGQPNQQNNQIKVRQPTDLFGTLNNTGTQKNLDQSLLVKPVQPVQKIQPPKKTKTQELEELTQKNMDKAMKETEQGQNWFDKGVNFFTRDNERIAKQNARTKAANQYQEKNGWNKDPEVLKFNKGTTQMGQETSKKIQTQIKGLNKFEKVMDKGAQVIQYVPVAGSVFNAGLAGNEKLAKARGSDMFGNSAEQTREMRNKVDFGMTNAEFDALDEKTRQKLHNIQNIGLALTPLDFTGLGGLAKSGGVSAAKKGVTQLVKDGAIDAATKAALKTAVKGSIKTALPSAIMGAGASAGIQQYLTGEVDPLAAAKAGVMTGGTSMLIPNGNKVKVPGANIIDEATDASPTVRQIDVKQPREISVGNATPEAMNIPVNRVQPQTRPIVDVAGDTPGVNRIKVPTADEAALARFAEQPQATPNRQIEGMLPGRVEDTTLYNRAEIDTERAALDQALANKEINKTQYKAASQELDSLSAVDDPGRPKTQIQVKEVREIPVDDATSMPVPVREAQATEAVAPNEVSVPVSKTVTNDAELPADVQEVLANPRKFTKQQVASARNQRKLANQMAKTKEATSEAIGRIDAATPEATTAEGFVPTGEFGKSVNGGAYQKVNRATEMQAAVSETANLAPTEVIRQARETAGQNGGGFNRRDIRNIAALFEQKRLERGTPEWAEARQILKEDGTNWGQTGALRNYTMRRNASADELISRFESKIYRMADDPSKIDSKLFDEVDAVETAFVDARDASKQAFNRFTEAPTSANAKAFHTAQDAAEKAEMRAKQVEFTVAQKAVKNNKDIQQIRELEKMAQEADMYQMDAVDASMLSGTGTFVRNFVNASVGSVEEGLMGKVSSRIASKLTGQNVGGGGVIKGFKKGAVNVVDASKARASAAGKNPLEHLKNWATTGNQLGDSVIDAQVSRNVGDHYTQLLKDQGYKKSELKNRASVMARMDPDNVAETYQSAARTAAGLGSGITRNNKIETTVKNIISDAISGGNPNALSENTAKLVTRMTMGFPTAIGRSVAEGAKRFTLGAPTFIKAMRTKDPQVRAVLIKEGIKQAGSGGLVIPSLFYGLGTSGAITGAYPEDAAERDRWQREGITENSIKIGDDYYQLPAYLGSWAVPALFYASLGRNNGDFSAAASDTAKIVPALLPTDQMTNVTDVINGRSDFGKFMSQTGASAVRAATPGGALLGQIGKMLDPTQNETNSGGVWENMVSKIMNGIPGANFMLEDKTDSEGNALRNPDPLALGLGAASTEQQAGIERSLELDTNTNNTLETMASYGAFADPNLKTVIDDPKTRKIYSDIVNGKQVNPEDLEKVQKAMVKGVSEKGTDTAYLEREQYDTNLTALQIKRELMAADPTQKPSDLKAMDTAIKRGEVYRDNEIPYDLISSYQDTSVSEWRKMGDSDSEDYDPDRYNQLWAIDELMAKNGVSYAKGKLDKQKFSAKGSGSGRGGSRGGSKLDTDFGTLKAQLGAPTVQAYDTADSRSGGGVPIIQKQRPNIVHKIGFSG